MNNHEYCVMRLAEQIYWWRNKFEGKEPFGWAQLPEAIQDRYLDMARHDVGSLSQFEASRIGGGSK